MAVKQWFRRLQPLQFVFVFFLTLTLFTVTLVASHITHALTLLVESFNLLCNLFALVGSFITYKYGNSQLQRGSVSSSLASKDEIKSLASLTQQNKSCTKQPQRRAERRLRNTFGWVRVDVLVMLIQCVFLTSLYFSLLVEAIQTLIHISHHDAMHLPIPVLVLGVISVLTNLVSHLLIGGYTFHQGNFQKPDESSSDVSIESKQQEITNLELPKPKRQGLQAMCKDLVGGVIVIICALLVKWADKDVAKYIDPSLSIVSVGLLSVLNFPFMKKSCFILLQTIPDHINIESLCSQLLTAFPVIINVHDLHVWQLTVDKIYTTAHIIFYDPKDYLRITNDVTNFFHSKGITNVTIQPEFFKDINSVELVSRKDLNKCLIPCVDPNCLDRHCCTVERQSLESVIVGPHSEKRDKKKHCHKVETEKSESKIINSSFSEVDATKNIKLEICQTKSEHSPVTKENDISNNDLVIEKEEQPPTKNSTHNNESIVSENCAKL